MPNQPMQIDKKEFQELLKEIQQYNKIDLVAQAIQTKYAKEMAGEDHEERLKAQQDSNELLKKIYDAIKTNGKQTEKVADKVDKLAKETKEYKPVSGIKDDRPTTIKEDLKSLVAGTKRFGSGIKSAVTGAIGSTASALKDPLGTLKEGAVSAGKLTEGVYKQAGDILATPEDYTVEGGRFAEAYSRTPEGTRYQKGGKGSLQVGLEKFNELKAKEEETKKVQQKIDEQKKYGFEPTKEDTDKLKKLKSQYAEADIRQKPTSAKEKIEAQSKTGNPNIIDEPQEVIAEETKKVQQKIDEQKKYGFEPTKEDTDKLKKLKSQYAEADIRQKPTSAKEKIEAQSKTQPKEPKAKPAAAAPVEAAGEGSGLSPLDMLGRGGAAGGKEVIAEETKKQTLTFKELLDTTKESLDQLKAIKDVLEGSQASENPNIVDEPQAAGGAAKAGFGAKALGALKAGGAMLGKGAIVAGKAVAGAALAKPALIAAGVGAAAYGAYRGYKALTGDKESQLQEQEEQVEPNPSQSTSTENPSTEEKPSFGDRLKNFFGFGKKEGEPRQASLGDAIARQEGRTARSVEGRQSGGPMTEGKPYVVGEDGPEIVVPNKSSKVMPTQSRSIDLGGGMKKKVNPDGSYEVSGGFGTKKYDKDGNLVSEVSPRFAGYQKETKVSGEVTESYQQGGLSASQTSQGGQVTGSSASAQVGQFVLEKSGENAGIRDLAQQGGGGQPVVMNNVSSNNTTTYVPVKGEPRPNSRGSALDRYNDRVAAY